VAAGVVALDRGLEVTGRVTLPAEARQLTDGVGLIRASSHGDVVVLTRDGIGAATPVDRRGRVSRRGYAAGSATPSRRRLSGDPYPADGVVARSRRRMPSPSPSVSPSIDSWKARVLPSGETVGFEA
jgi:hypothetical protein